MADIPDHLIDALIIAWNSNPNLLDDDEAREYASKQVEAVLAALRPEDAPLVDAWLIDRKFLATVFRIQTERDEARAEVERLRDVVRELRAMADRHYDQIDRLTAENKLLSARLYAQEGDK